MTLEREKSPWCHSRHRWQLGAATARVAAVTARRSPRSVVGIRDDRCVTAAPSFLRASRWCPAGERGLRSPHCGSACLARTPVPPASAQSVAMWCQRSYAMVGVSESEQNRCWASGKNERVDRRAAQKQNSTVQCAHALPTPEADAWACKHQRSRYSAANSKTVQSRGVPTQQQQPGGGGGAVLAMRW